MVEEMSIAEYHEYQRTGKLPKRMSGATRMETLTTVAKAAPDLIDGAADVVKRKNKFGAIKTEVDGIKFDSKREAARYVELKAFESAGAIANLETQVRYVFEHNGVRITTYRPDFRYTDTDTGKQVVEDVKSHKGKGGTGTRDYVIRKKLMKAFYDIDIVEVY